MKKKEQKSSYKKSNHTPLLSQIIQGPKRGPEI